MHLKMILAYSEDDGAKGVAHVLDLSTALWQLVEEWQPSRYVMTQEALCEYSPQPLWRNVWAYKRGTRTHRYGAILCPECANKLATILTDANLVLLE